MSFYLLILFLFLAVISIAFLLYKNNSLHKQINDKIKHSVTHEETSIEPDKKKLEEKNKKLFLMSETVYKEKKKVDEENEKLRIEKEKLKVEKTKVEEKVKKLWGLSTAVHKEKEKVEKIKAIIEQKHREVTESITYAERIQNAILPLMQEIHSALPESFVLFMPRDIVSGDFYWFTVKNEKIFLAAVDCTGHGVPGALMSMVGNTLLNEIIDQKGITDPGKILNELDNNVRFVLKQDNSPTSTRDGMDICLCVFEKGKSEIQYAGANRPLWLIRKTPLPSTDGEEQTLPAKAGQSRVDGLEEIKGTNAAIGGIREEEVVFQTHSILLKTGDNIYLSSDGYADQYNREDKKKLMKRKFKELLLSVSDKPMKEQMQFLEKYHLDWKGNIVQTDDILVMGVRI